MQGFPKKAHFSKLKIIPDLISDDKEVKIMENIDFIYFFAIGRFFYGKPCILERYEGDVIIYIWRRKVGCHMGHRDKETYRHAYERTVICRGRFAPDKVPHARSAIALAAVPDIILRMSSVSAPYSHNN